MEFLCWTQCNKIIDFGKKSTFVNTHFLNRFPSGVWVYGRHGNCTSCCCIGQIDLLFD